MDWEKYSFVIRAKNRKAVLLSLYRPKSPSQIAKELNISLPHVSRALKELEKEGLVECLTPNEKVGRIYKRTLIGDEIAYFIKMSNIWQKQVRDKLNRVFGMLKRSVWLS